LSGCDLSGVERVTFKDKKQEKIFMVGAKNFRGEVVCADEDKNEKEYSSLISSIIKRLDSGGMGE
jgi:plastocyanin domain-containing protein